jgi:DNA-binding response OmpR family regulator
MGVNSGGSVTFKSVRRQNRPPHIVPRIVVAEDDAEMRRLIAETLEKEGYDVTEVTDGMRLLVHVVARDVEPDRAFDLVIADLRMPVSSGMQVLRGLRNSGWTLPFILCTAFGDDATRMEAEELGAIFFNKPFALDDLRKVVRELLTPNEES